MNRWRKRVLDERKGMVGRVPRRLLTGRAALLAGLGLLAAGCAQDAPQDTWDPAGENAQKIHNLQWPVFAIAGLVLVIVASAVLWCVVRYRDRGQAIPEQSHGKPALEIGLTILPALILIGVAVPTVGTLMALNRTDDTECVVNITGQQWWWEIDYPAGDCGGVASSCYSQFSSYACSSQRGCYWSSLTDSCSGSSWGCSLMSGSSSCTWLVVFQARWFAYSWK